MISDIIVADLEGIKTAFLAPEVPEDAPALVREGIARRRVLYAEGTCPCGAAVQLPSRQQRRQAERQGRIPAAVIEHESDCPASDDILLPAVRRWLKPDTISLKEWLIGRFDQGPAYRCPHRAGSRMGPASREVSIWALWDDYLRCPSCPPRVDVVPGSAQDRTCDRCGSVCPVSEEPRQRIQPGGWQLGGLRVIFGMCPGCAALDPAWWTA